MIQYKPTISTNFTCLHCDSTDVTITSTQFLGMHTLATCQCAQCKEDFYGTYPIGHAADFPIVFDKKGDKVSFCQKTEVWFARPLLAAFFEEKTINGNVEKKVFYEAKNVVILNCLDDCYGHVFLKLMNAKRHLHQQQSIGVVVIIPKSFEWLLPNGIAEVWSVDLPMNRLNYLINDFDEFVKKELERFGTVYFSKAYTHLEHTKIDLSAFTKTKRFDLSQFGEQKPTITFALREDKFWLNSRFDDFLYKACVKFKKLHYLKNYFAWKQNCTISKLAKLIKSEMSEMNFIATGLGKTGNISDRIKDKRYHEMTDEREKEWCSIYAKSHLIIGVHGSNMLIPTSLSAGFIEILPRHKIPHLAEDTLFPHRSRYAIFLGRHLDEFTNTKLVKRHAISMLKDFSSLYKNTEAGE